MNIEHALAQEMARRIDAADRLRADFMARCCPACEEEMSEGAYLECDECGHEVTQDEVREVHASHADVAASPCEYAICAAWRLAAAPPDILG